MKSLYCIATVAAAMGTTLALSSDAMAAPLTTDNLVYNWVANTSDGTADWQSGGAASNTTAVLNTHQESGLAAAPDAVLMPVTSATGLSKAFFFNGTPAGGGSEARLDIDPSGGAPFVDSFNGLAPDASFEVFFKPSDLVGNEVIFETGGNARGLSLALNGDTLYAFSKQAGGADDSELVMSATLTPADIADFAQVVWTTDGASSHNLYLNGVLVDSDNTNYGDFGGGDVAAIAAGSPNGYGGMDGNGGGAAIDDAVNYGALDGAIGILRVYNDVLTPAEVLANSTHIVPEPSSIMLGLLAMSGCLATRRRK